MLCHGSGPVWAVILYLPMSQVVLRLIFLLFPSDIISLGLGKRVSVLSLIVSSREPSLIVTTFDNLARWTCELQWRHPSSKIVVLSDWLVENALRWLSFELDYSGKKIAGSLT